MYKNKKAQNWYIDYIIGFVIFTLGLFLFLQYSPNFTKSDMGQVILDSEILSNILVSEGIPSDWNSLNYFQIGLIYNNKLDIKKLKNLVVSIS